MKTIGLIGGMSWESTAVYYQHLNRGVRDRLGGLHSAEILMWSFDFAEIEALQAQNDWQAATIRMVDAARRLEVGGADCILICTNTMHRMYEAVQDSVKVPVLHIADATARAIKVAECVRPLLFATRYTMEQSFYRGRVESHDGIDITIPDDTDRREIHRIIYEELCQGIIRTESKQIYLDIARKYKETGCDGIIFGCTEVGLLVQGGDFDMPAFDTTHLHIDAAIRFALDGTL